MTPIPTVPLGNLPLIRKYLVSTIAPFSNQARRLGIKNDSTRLITLYGENFGPEWTVWL